MLASLFLFCLASLATAAPTAELEKRGTRTSAPSGCLSVGTSGGYSTIGAALTALGSGTTAKCIFINQGTYAEQLTISYGGPLTLYGYTTDTGDYKNNKVTITHTVTSTAAGSLDASSTVNIRSANFKAYNIIFVNGYGKGSQAVAVTANGDKQGYYGCTFKGYQDTLYAKSGKQYYSNCQIIGATDFIFGDAAAWFGECTIAANGAGYITANSRETSSDTAWYVFDHSTITNDASVTAASLAGKVYLGRPWRVLARVRYQYSSLSAIINAAGWTTMAEGATPLFTEYQNTGAGSGTSARVYGTVATSAVTKTTLWGSDYATWIDTSY